MHNAYVKIESTINTYYPISVACDDCDYQQVFDSLAEAHDTRDKHIYATCEHENTSTFPTNWPNGDETICDDCERTYNNAMQEWPDVDGYFRSWSVM